MQQSGLDLRKIEQEAPELLSLVKKSRITLEKKQLHEHVARVALMLDVSGSMSSLYNSGKVDELVKRVLPIALQFDDDGQIDVFAFSTNAQEVGEYGLGNYKECVKDIRNNIGINGGTYYDRALSLIEKKYKGTQLPVYVIFVTDGDTENKHKVEQVIRSLSKEKIFLQFVALGAEHYPDQNEGSASAPAKPGLLSRIFGIGGSSSQPSRSSNLSGGFSFLAGLDDLEGRVVDNANFFAIKHPTAVDDDRLYELLMNEYPQWLKAARAARIL